MYIMFYRFFIFIVFYTLRWHIVYFVVDCLSVVMYHWSQTWITKKCCHWSCSKDLFKRKCPTQCFSLLKVQKITKLKCCLEHFRSNKSLDHDLVILTISLLKLPQTWITQDCQHSVKQFSQQSFPIWHIMHPAEGKGHFLQYCILSSLQ